MRSESTESTTPARLQSTTAPESRAVTFSMPVPTIGRIGAQQRNRLALHVRSHQRAVGVVVLQERDQAGGHRDELLRADVDVLDLVRGSSATKLPAWRALTSSATMRPFSSSSTLAWAMTYLSSSQADRYSQWASNSARLLLGRSESRLAFSISVRGEHLAHLEVGVAGVQDLDFVRPPTPLTTLRYGLSMKPYSLMRAKQESDEIRPMFGPSGVSIGQMRP